MLPGHYFIFLTQASEVGLVLPSDFMKGESQAQGDEDLAQGQGLEPTSGSQWSKPEAITAWGKAFGSSSLLMPLSAFKQVLCLEGRIR